MTCHSSYTNQETIGRSIVLAGNPNVGKSVFFNDLTGQYVDVSNYPGTTVETYRGTFGKDTIIDTPGVYGVSSFNDEERVARDVILDADAVVNVVNAARLRQDLFLTLQIIDAGLPVIVALNMMDEARAQGIVVDVQELSRALGVPVLACAAILGEGLAEVKAAVADNAFRRGIRDKAVEAAIQTLPREIPESHRLLIVEGDTEIAERHGQTVGGLQDTLYRERRARADEIASHVTKQNEKTSSLSVKLGRWALRPITGLPLLAIMLTGIFYTLGVIIATHVVGFTEGTMMEGFYEPFVRLWIGRIVPEATIIGQLLIGPYGLLTMGVTYLFGLLLPLVVGFYLLLGVLEDSGYLPRVAVLADRSLRTVGLNGRAVIPIILGFGCVTMATVTTRLLGSRRERFIATLLLGLAIPCSAQLGVISGMIAPLGAAYIFAYLVVIVAVFGLVGVALNRVVPGKSSDLFIELPPMRWPRLTNILTKTWQKTKHFLGETIVLFGVGSVLLGLINVVGGLNRLNAWARPLVSGWLGLPDTAATPFLMGILRRDFGAAGLTDLALTPHQTLVALIVMTLFVPCIASLLIILKERGWKEGIVIWFGSFFTAFLVGGIAHRLIF